MLQETVWCSVILKIYTHITRPYNKEHTSAADRFNAVEVGTQPNGLQNTIIYLVRPRPLLRSAFSRGVFYDNTLI